MLSESRAQRRAVAVLCVVPVVLGVACASKSDADVFDSTPKPLPGTPSAGGARSSGGTAGWSATGGNLATGGAATIPAPAQGGTSGAEPPDPSGGEATGMGGATDTAGGTASGGKPATASGGKLATGGVESGGESSGGESSGGESSGGEPSSTGGNGTGGAATCAREPELCDGVDNDCDGEVDEETCPEGCEGFTLEGESYMFCARPEEATGAHEACRDEGMRLAWIETQKENEALLEKLAALMDVEPVFTGDGEQAQVRIGGTDADTEGVWQWEQPGESVVFWKHRRGGETWDGAVVDGMFVNWSDKRPNGSSLADQDCLVIEIQEGPDGKAGEWNDVRCSGKDPFVCERP